MKINEGTKELCCRIISTACDGDKAQTDLRTQLLRRDWTVEAMDCIARQLTAAGYEW